MELFAAVLLAIALSVLGRETWGWLPRLSRSIIWIQTLPLPKGRRALRREEWRAELATEYDDRRVTGFLWALSLCPVSAWERLTTPISSRAAGPSVTSRPPLVESGISSWVQVAARLSDESSARERRLRHVLGMADAGAITWALLATVVLASSDALTPLALLLVPAVVGAAKILGLYESDDQRIRKTTAEELPRLAQLGSLLVLGIWLGDRFLIGGGADKDQALVVGATFVIGAVLGRRAARRVVNRGRSPERCLFIGDTASYMRLRAIFDRHDLFSELVEAVPITDVIVPDKPDGRVDSLAVLGMIARAEAHRLIIGPHGLSNAMTFELLEAASAAGTRVSLLPDMLEVVGSSVASTTSTARRCSAVSQIPRRCHNDVR